MRPDARDVDDEMNRERNRLTGAPVRKTNIGRQDTVRQARERLLRGVRVDGAQAAEMAGVERLQQIERFGAAHLADQDAIRPVTQAPRGADPRS